MTLGLLAAVAAGVADRPRITTEMTTLVSAPPDSVLPVPSFSHVFVIVLENKAYDRIVGSADAPYINELIARYGLAAAYQAVAHPSQPNYLALVSGSTQGVVDNEPHDLAAPSLFDQLERAGRHGAYMLRTSRRIATVAPRPRVDETVRAHTPASMSPR